MLSIITNFLLLNQQCTKQFNILS